MGSKVGINWARRAQERATLERVTAEFNREFRRLEARVKNKKLVNCPEGVTEGLRKPDFLGVRDHQ